MFVRKVDFCFSAIGAHARFKPLERHRCSTMNPPSATVLPRRSRSWAERARPLAAQVGGMRRHGAGNASTTRPARRKNLEADTLDFFPCNPLKSHKTAKGIFGNPWTETA